MFNYAPIAIFVYKRPEHTKKLLDSLFRNHEISESQVFVFCDAPNKQEDWVCVEETRQVIRDYSWHDKVSIVERTKNLGLSESIYQGVTELCEKFGRVIVLEDDLVLSKYFLQYMNDALNIFEFNANVMHISGYMFPLSEAITRDFVFLPMINSWGWATWQRSWKHFDSQKDKQKLLRRDFRLRRKFDINGLRPFYKFLDKNNKGTIDSWAIRWYLDVFMLNGLAVFPKETLVHNIGFDGTGTHCKKTDQFSEKLADQKMQVHVAEQSSIDHAAFKEVQKYFLSQKSFLGYRLYNFSSLFF
jgi:hypothetical protein